MPRTNPRSRDVKRTNAESAATSPASLPTPTPVVQELRTSSSEVTERISKNASPPNASSLNDSPEPSSSDEKASRKPRRGPVLLIYRQLFTLLKFLRANSTPLNATKDKLLASIGYPAKLVGFLFAASKLSSLSSLIADWRTFGRVVATPATLQWSLDLLLNNSNPDTLDRYADYIQAVAGSAYQILENIAYFSGKSVISINPNTELWIWAISSQFWAVHVAIELLRAPYYHYYLKKPVSTRNLVVNLAWAPLTVHWSTTTGLLNNGWVGLLGTIACWPNLVYQWKAASV